MSKYLGSIDKLELRPATDPAKFPQIMVTYLVIDGELTGRKSSEFLSLSPKAAFRLKKWFNKFGLAESLTGLEFDEETNLLLDPDLVGVNVIFQVYQDPKLYQGEISIRTQLLEVLDDEGPAAPAPVRAAPVARAVAKPSPAPAPTEDAESEDPPEAVPVAASAARPSRFAAKAATSGPARRQLK